MTSTRADVVLRIETVGHATLQDLGRPGHTRDGVSANGAADHHAARTANTLVGNSLNAPLLEITGSSLTFATTGPVLMAVTGAAHRALVNGYPLPAWETTAVRAGSVITVEASTVGHRNYVAFQGLLAPEEPRLLGSVSPDPLLGIGKTLTVGETIPLRTGFLDIRHPYFDQVVLRLGARRPRLSLPALIEMTEGPDAAEFEGGLQGPAHRFRVAAQSDYVGLRLRGLVPKRFGTSEILSRGVPVGAVEIPPDGGLLVLLRGRLVTAGYPVIGVSTTVDLDRLAQLRPGDEVMLRMVDHLLAEARVRHQYEALLGLAKRVYRVLASLGLSHLIADKHLSQGPATARSEPPRLVRRL